MTHKDLSMTGNAMVQGRPGDIRREAFAMRFNIDHLCKSRLRGMMTDEFMKQLSECRSDAARRLLLGVSEQFSDEERAAFE